MPSTAVYTTDRDSFPFTVSAKLVSRALAHPSKDTAWKDSADRWLVTITNDLYPGSMEIDYWTGVVLRGFRTPAKIETSEPIEPSAATVLSSIGSDLRTALELPPDDALAMDYLQDEFGHEDKPSELLRMVHALRSIETKVMAMLKHTGLNVDEFADWASELEA